MSGNASQVYLVGVVDGCYKIGFSVDPTKRLMAYAPLLPREPEIIHSISANDAPWLERTLHMAFTHRHIRGEWFQLVKSEIGLFCSVDSIAEMSDLPKPILRLFQRNHPSEPIERPLIIKRQKQIYPEARPINKWNKWNGPYIPKKEDPKKSLRNIMDYMHRMQLAAVNRAREVQNQKDERR